MNLPNSDTDSNEEENRFLSKELENLGSDDESGFLDNELKELDTDDEPDKKSRNRYRPSIHYHSSEEMPELDDESVHLAVTSPPYNTGWQYGSHDDDLDYMTEYLPMLARVFTEVHRVLVPGGRFCVNVPSLLRSGAAGGYPIASDITRMMVSSDNIGLGFYEDGEHGSHNMEFDGLEDITKLRVTTDWVVREEISWVKDFNTDGLAPNGSFPRPWGILLNNFHESIIVFQKPGKRTYEDLTDDVIEDSKINKEQDDLCDDVWRMPSDSWSPRYTDDEDIPVFPEELPKRCIRLWTYKDDTVLDPFSGRGTTLKVAKELRRESVGYEVRKELGQDIRSYVGTEETMMEQFL